jgi:hypothetical protein
MTTSTEIIPLANLEYLPYLNPQGIIDPELGQKIGVYGIFNEDKVLQYVGYSRNLYLSLKQHLIRQPNQCYWLKLQIITRPNRTLLDHIRSNWIEENGTIPRGNGEDEAKWTQPIDAKLSMTEEEKQQYQQGEEIAKIKLLKKISRRVEAEITTKLQQRNLQEEIRFNPKLKEQGLLDLK